MPEGAVSDRRKAGLVKDATAVVLRAAGLTEADALRVWVLIHEQAEGTWGAAGGIVRCAELVALAQQSREAVADA
ncbi:4-oxalocrotonate tautomerase family protein [Amycolatopsis japonica]|uniref:tautomerase family protein n=1 Tax=Amycolatopsis japonica TaxID=208439 RepID=UPI0036714530